MSDPVEEIWVFGGNRVLKNGKRVQAWLPVQDLDDLDPVLLFSAKGSFVVGNEYRVMVSRSEKSITKHGTPEYHGRHDDNALRASLEAAHTVAERHLRVRAMERKDREDSALEAALEPVLAVARSSRAFNREVFALYVFQRIMRA